MKSTMKNSRLFRVLNVRRALPLLESNKSLKLFNQLTRVHFIRTFFFYDEVVVASSLNLNSSKVSAARCGLLPSFLFYSTFSLMEVLLSLRISSSKPPPYLFAYSYILNFL